MAGARNFGAWAALLGAAATAAVLATAAGPADAAYPGANGRIAFSSNPNVWQENNSSIYTVRPGGKGQIRLTRPGGTMSDTSPSYSPNGKRIVFERFDGTGCSQIFSMRSDGSGRTRLTDQTNDGGCNFAPAWGPAGRIAFASTRDGNAEVYVMNADGTNQTNLSNNPGVDQNPAFSPDGTEIAFETRRESDDFEVYKMDASNGSDQTNLTDTPGVDSAPSFSPGGDRIAFESNRESTRDVYVMGSDGSNPERLTVDGGQQRPSPRTGNA